MRSSSGKSLALVDSSIIISVIKSEENHSKQLRKFKDEIRKEIIVPMVSFPILFEVLHVMRAIAFKKNKKKLTREIKNLAGGKREEHYKKFLKVLNQDVNKDFKNLLRNLKKNDYFKGPTKLQIEINEDIMNVVHRNIGRIKKDKNELWLSSLNAGDIFHLVTAKRLRCDEIVTFDLAFEKLISDPFLGGILIQTYKK